jgi:alkylation response protein AidB-like acyl-CoA dehydrogenase
VPRRARMPSDSTHRFPGPAQVDDDPAAARVAISQWLDASLAALADPGDPLDVGAWRGELMGSRFVTATWPVEYGGLGLGPDSAAAINNLLAERCAPVPLSVVTVLMAGSMLQRLGTTAQKQRFLRPLADGSEVWCQLFSEPGAGSDLASLATTAVRKDNGWNVNGHKIWSSFSMLARRGLLLTRTRTDVPKHNGITAFVLDMRLPGVQVRPLRQITGDATFAEVFFDDVHLTDEDIIGEVNDGWQVAQLVLSSERALQGGRSISPLQRVGGVSFERILEQGRPIAAEMRDRVTALWVEDRAVQLLGAQLAAVASAAPLVKIAMAEHNQALQELALDLAGSSGAAAPESDNWTEDLRYGFLRSRANTIGGGTSEILRTVIGERLLELPKEPDSYRGKPWSEIPHS